MLVLRRFAPADAAAVEELAALTRAPFAGRPDPAARAGGGDPTPDSYLQDGGEFVVGLWEGRVVAIGALRPAGPVDAVVEQVSVHPRFQRRGFGRAVLTHLEAHARRAGHRRIRLETTVRQTAARALYEGAGFREVGRGELSGLAVVYYAKRLS